MSAAVCTQPNSLFQEGMNFWQELGTECRRHADAINAAALSEGFPEDHLIRCETRGGIHIEKPGVPSTDVNIRLLLKPWGLVIAAEVTGLRDPNRRFSTAEIEVPLGRDLDGSVVAIFDEGRSFSVRDLTRYLMQHFRRCFPVLALPC